MPNTLCVVPDFIKGTASAHFPKHFFVCVYLCVEGSDISSCLGSYGDAGSRTGRVREVEMTGRWAHGHRRTSNTHSPMGIRADASACESVAVMT